MASIVAADAADDLNHDGLVSERSPLLRRLTGASAGKSINESSSDTSIPKSLKRRITILIYIAVFVIMFGETVQQAARIQIYEDVICENYYGTNLQSTQTNGTAGDEARCKIRPVQDELAEVKGYEDFFLVLPTILCSVPYGVLANRIGRKKVIIISLVGIVLSKMFSISVCYWNNIFPIRLVWLVGVIQLIGGGSSVCSSIVHVMVTDFATEAERTQIFLFIHAMNVLSGFLSPFVSAALMEAGHAWAVVMIGNTLMGLATVVILPAIPETLYLRPQILAAESHSSRASIGSPEPPKPSYTLLEKLKSSTASLLDSLSISRQALLLVVIYTPSLFAREAFQMTGLIYVGKKFGVRFSLVNILISIYEAIQAILVFLLIPTVTFFVQNPRFGLEWSAWKRDRIYTIGSAALMAAGHTMLGWAPTVWTVTLGLVTLALGSGISSTVLSLLGSAVEPEKISSVYSVTLMLTVVTANGMAPVNSALFSKGMELGWVWIGLPFMGIGFVMAIMLIASFFIASDKPELDYEVEE